MMQNANCVESLHSNLCANVVLRKPLGSNSLGTKLKAHYSEQLRNSSTLQFMYQS